MRKALLAAALIAQASAATAQVAPDIAEKTRALGQTMNPAEGYSPYDGRFDMVLFNGLTITRAIAYGSAPQHVLDIYMADAGRAERRPVLVFVHGGGFVGGRRGGQPYPDNIPAWAAHRGMVGVSIDYRLAPDNLWPAGAADLAAALRWVGEHAVRYGGDPSRIVLMGHSAGANHVADYLARPEARGAEFAAVKGAVLLSPNYPDTLVPGGEPHVYYPPDAELQTARPVVDRLQASGVPLFIGNAEFDPDIMQKFASQARDWLCGTAAGCPGYVRLADHNHFTEGMSLGTADESLSGPLLAWMRRLGIL